MTLTALACKNAKPGKKPRKLFDGGGLYLEVTAAGNKLWRLKYYHAKKEKRMSLGPFPEVSLLEAREKREEARKLLAEGVDPSVHRQKRLAQVHEDSQNTFERIAREWHAHNAPVWSENHARTVMRRLEADVFPRIGRLPIKDVTAPVLLECIREIEKRKAFEVARRVLQYCGGVFRFAIVTGRGERDVSADLKGALQPYKKGHFAAMDAGELPSFLRKLHANEARMFPQTKYAVEFMLLTFVWTSELVKAEWTEFDMDGAMWTVPGRRMKMKQDHMVPLSGRAVEILRQLERLNGHRKHVFTSQRDPRKHMSTNAILVALDRMGYRGIHTGHGFRTLAMSTIKEKLGYRHEVVDRQLAHSHKNPTDKAYDRAKFLDDRKKMMQEWAEYIEDVSSRQQTKIP